VGMANGLEETIPEKKNRGNYLWISGQTEKSAYHWVPEARDGGYQTSVETGWSKKVHQAVVPKIAPARVHANRDPYWVRMFILGGPLSSKGNGGQGRKKKQTTHEKSKKWGKIGTVQGKTKSAKKVWGGVPHKPPNPTEKIF